MRLYQVTSRNWDYDKVVSAVVWAESNDQAVELFRNQPDVAQGPYRARAIRLEGTKPRVIFTHFNAG